MAGDKAARIDDRRLDVHMVEAFRDTGTSARCDPSARFHLHIQVDGDCQRISNDGYRPNGIDLGPVDDHFAAITPATGRSPPRSSRRSCHDVSRSPGTPRSSRKSSRSDASTHPSPGRVPGARREWLESSRSTHIYEPDQRSENDRSTRNRRPAQRAGYRP